MSEHVNNDRFDRAIEGIRDAISEEGARTRSELNARIDVVRTDASEAHGRIRDDLTTFMADTITERARLEAKVDDHGRRLNSLEGRDQSAVPWPSLTRSQKGALISVIVALTGAAADAFIHGAKLLKWLAEAVKP